MKVNAILLIFFSGLLTCPGASESLVERVPKGVIDVEGRQVFIHCVPGSGPTVLIDAGLGEASGQWLAVMEGLADEFSLCAFDRPGYGGSEPGPLSRTPSANAATLHELRAAAGLEGPFVLVGHSLGGLNALAFWAEHPSELAGMILLDPPPRAWLERRRFPGLWEMAVAAGEELQAASEEARAAALPEAPQLAAMASEHKSMMELGAATMAVDSFGDLPLLVIASARPNPAFGDSAEAYQQFWVEENRRLAARSSRGRIEVLSGVGHNMNQEAPELVVSLIRDVLQQF
jgi:pimeloyl-ACP methyl ester carboxylesterase